MPPDPKPPSDEDLVETMVQAAWEDISYAKPVYSAMLEPTRNEMRRILARIRAPLEARGIERAWAECRDIPAAEFRLRALARQRAAGEDGK